MQLTLYSDYSLRVLLYLSQMPKRTTTVVEIANFYKISKNHLVKVVHHLAELGFIISTQGKGGGIRLAKPASDITFGEVVLKTEPHFFLTECFNHKGNHCAINAVCSLKSILQQALQAFFNVLQKYTLTDANNVQLEKQITAYLTSLSKKTAA